MALSNFLLTVMGVGAVWLIVRSDLRHSSAMLSKNIRHVRTWLEKEAAAGSAAAEKEAEKLKLKELEHQQHAPKEEKP